MEMEFRSYRDDAWYDVQIRKESIANNGGNGNGGNGPRLRVKFTGFSDDHDEVIDAKDLKSLNDVEALRCRFRSVSAQLQDSECSQVRRGMIVCAAHSACPDDRRFYDAVIDEVMHMEHRFENGEEQCTCIFLLQWQHGPNQGLLTDQVLENICRVREPPLAVEKLDPLLTSFLKSVRKGVKRFPDSNGRKLKQDTRVARRSWGDDIDIGGVPYMIIIDNLEKGISPSTIMEFIHEQLSLSCLAFVSPSRLLESCTRGAILLLSRRDFNNVSAFLENPNHIIVSSRGRPWLMTEKTPAHDTLRASIETLTLTSQVVSHSKRTGTCNELKVLTSGTKEYTKTKQLKNLFSEFTKHQCKLHQRLVVEEGRILQLPDDV